MINIIRIAVRFDSKPSLIFIDMYSNSLITAVDDYCNNRRRSYITEEPSKEQKDKGDFVYRWEIEVDDCSVDAHELFDIVNPVPGGKVLLVDVRDKKYDPKYNNSNVGYYWTNEGSTWYHDSERGYKDPFYRFHVNGHEEYRIVYLPHYVNEYSYNALRKAVEEGVKFSWECTGSWNNWMKATTLEDAIEEFEEMYKQELWESIEGYKKSLDKATDAFREFDKYRWNKKW